MANTGLAIFDNKAENKFEKIFSAIHNVPAERARQMYEVEKFNLLKQLQDKQELTACTSISIMGVFLDVISAGLSFSPASALVYIKSRNHKTSKLDDRGNNIWEPVLEFQPTAKGKVYLCQRVGSIDRITEPEVVFDNDEFKRGTDKDGKKWLVHSPGTPRGKRVIAAFCFVVFPDGAREPVWLDEIDIMRRRKASERQNGSRVDGKFQPGSANPLYSSFEGQIDPGFLGAKVVDVATKYLRKQEINSSYMAPNEEPEETIEPVIDPLTENNGPTPATDNLYSRSTGDTPEPIMAEAFPEVPPADDDF